MSGYLLSVIGIVLISAILSNALPKGKTYKTLKTVIRMACLLVVISPVLTVFQKGNVDGEKGDFFESFFKEKVINTDRAYIDYCREKTVIAAEKHLEQAIEKEFSVSVAVTIYEKTEQTELSGTDKTGEWVVVEKAALYANNSLSTEIMKEIEEYVKNEYSCQTEWLS